ncbi:DUF4157 domain-containing protein [Mycobacterium sp. DL99]|uniref:eCIS core domain-containing protein n=1 Tax=Mycobacterium sp. DL99 TaxID=2528957 RepID=UPI0014368C83|nr:DUF4157 domain-containing protein [Mycobacterium sp. DL99]
MDRDLGNGRRLSDAERRLLGDDKTFDADRVRLHTGSEAAESAVAQGASAYAYGDDVVFGPGKYRPGTQEGDGLLRHELAHVVAQSRTSAPPKIERDVDPPTSGGTWTKDEAQANFTIVAMNRLMASSMHAGTTILGPGFESWSNPSIFKIRAPETLRLHNTFWVDPGDAVFPSDQFTVAITNDMTYTAKDGTVLAEAHYRDDHPRYDGHRTALDVSLGSKTPAARDMPIHQLQIDRAGTLQWSVYFDFGTTGKSIIVVADFEIETDSPPPAAGASPATPGGDEKRPPSSNPFRPLPAPTPQNTVGQITVLTELIERAQDAATKDRLVRTLRDLLASLQPVLPKDEAKKMIDDAIRRFINDGIKDGLMKILELVVGRSATRMPDGPPPTGPNVPQADLGEHKTPQLTFPLDVIPKPRTKLGFEFKDIRGTQVGSFIRFHLVVPADYDSLGDGGAKRIVVVPAGATDGPPVTVKSLPVTAKEPIEVEIRAPSEPGRYVLEVWAGMTWVDEYTVDIVPATPR